MTVIDSHLHIWDPDRADYPWLGADLAPINRSVSFDEVRPSLRRAGVEAVVLVQSADNAEDTQLMLAVAAETPEIAAIVAFVPLADPAEAERQLAELAHNPLVVGVRNLIHTIDDPDWLLRPDVDESLGLIEQAGLTFDVVGVLPRHLELVPIIGERHPGLRIVLDHVGHPPVGQADMQPWAGLLAAAAENPNVFAKVSGLYSTVGDAGTWSPGGIRPFIERALEQFGPSRLMYGGDWPISVLAGGYDRVWDGLSSLFDEVDPGDRDQLLWRTAAEFYSISRFDS